jgi:hypothetical protein
VKEPSKFCRGNNKRQGIQKVFACLVKKTKLVKKETPRDYVRRRVNNRQGIQKVFTCSRKKKEAIRKETMMMKITTAMTTRFRVGEKRWKLTGSFRPMHCFFFPLYVTQLTPVRS